MFGQILWDAIAKHTKKSRFLLLCFLSFFDLVLLLSSFISSFISHDTTLASSPWLSFCISFLLPPLFFLHQFFFSFPNHFGIRHQYVFHLRHFYTKIRHFEENLTFPYLHFNLPIPERLQAFRKDVIRIGSITLLLIYWLMSRIECKHIFPISTKFRSRFTTFENGSDVNHTIID